MVNVENAKKSFTKTTLPWYQQLRAILSASKRVSNKMTAATMSCKPARWTRTR